MKIKSTFLGVIVLVIMFGGVYGSSLLGWWRTTGRRIPRQIQSGQFEGASDPADIRGSYAFQDVSNAFNIPSSTLNLAFGLPSGLDGTTFFNKDLEAIYADIDPNLEVGTDSMRWFVAWYKGMPYQPGEGTAMPQPAADILRNRGGLTSEQIVFMETRIVALPLVDLDAQSSETQPSEAEEHDEGEAMVRGKTTFADLLDWGLTQAQIEAIIGGPMPNRLTLLRDYCQQNGLSFGQIKAELQAALDQ